MKTIQWKQRPSGMLEAGDDLTLEAWEYGLTFRACVSVMGEPLLDGFDYDTLDAAKLAAETFAREWVAKQAAALGDGWVSVEERLPENGECVLIAYAPLNSSRTLGAFGTHERGRWSIGSPSSLTGATVTHWRPLPSLPVAEVEG